MEGLTRGTEPWDNLQETWFNHGQPTTVHVVQEDQIPRDPKKQQNHLTYPCELQCPSQMAASAQPHWQNKVERKMIVRVVRFSHRLDKAVERQDKE